MVVHANREIVVVGPHLLSDKNFCKLVRAAGFDAVQYADSGSEDGRDYVGKGVRCHNNLTTANPKISLMIPKPRHEGAASA